MIPLPSLTAPEYRALVEDLRRGPYIAVPSVKILDLEHNEIDDVSDRMLDGQVDWKLNPVGKLGGAVSSSSLQLTLADPSRVVPLDAGTATSGAVFYDQLISAGMFVTGPRVAKTVLIPCFTGPVSKMVRAGGQVVINGVGKEQLATGMVGETVVYGKSTSKIAAIRDLLRRAGEVDAHIKLPGLAATLPADVVLTSSDVPWRELQEIVSSMSRQALYDARGDFRMRALSGDPQRTITDGDGGTLLTEPEVTYDTYNGYNGVRVTGPNNAGKKISKTVWLPASHPLSPVGRRRNGMPFRRLLDVTEAKLRNEAEAVAIATTHLRRLAREYVTVTADVMPCWLDEPGDVVALRTRSLGYLEQTLTEFSVPLMPGAATSMGANKLISRPKATNARRRSARSTIRVPRSEVA